MEYHADSEYLNLMRDILENGADKGDRTGTGTRSIFGTQMKFNLSKGFPLLTTKKMFTKGIIHELLWFLNGDTNIKYLKDNKVNIWDGWANEHGDVGPVYGKQWVAWPDHDGNGINQIKQVVEQIRDNPNSRRLIVCAWNVADIPYMGLPTCHCLFQFYVADGKLSCQLYQRSCDYFLGVPFNIASYALLTHMIAQQCDLDVGEFIWIGGDTHIYNNHFEQCEEQLSRSHFAMPKLLLNKKGNIFDYNIDDFQIVEYESHETIKAPISV